MRLISEELQADSSCNHFQNEVLIHRQVDTALRRYFHKKSAKANSLNLLDIARAEFQSVWHGAICSNRCSCLRKNMIARTEGLRGTWEVTESEGEDVTASKLVTFG